jgi:histidyl-tRNA synthetase
MAQRIDPRILKGFRDFLPQDEIRRSELTDRLVRVFGRHGFVPIDTPVLEYTEVLLGKGGGETDKQIYRFTDNGGRDVAMRFDLTVPFARYMAQHKGELYLPFKRYHVAKVFRGENTQRGRYREFTQCDFDIVGTDTASADFEILLLVVRSMEALGLSRFTVRISHRGIFNRFLDHLGAGEHSVEILRTVDKMRKIGPEKTRAELARFVGAGNAEKILTYIQPEGSTEATLSKMQELAGGRAEDTERLERLFSWAAETGISDHVALDPSITRGLDYYTGCVYETFLDDIEGIGSVCSGGRYNDLASLYTKEQIPGVGASVGLDRLIAALDELGQGDVGRSALDVLVLCLDEGLIGYYHHIADRLRAAGLSAEVYPEAKKLGGQFKFAEQKGAQVGIICGPEERARDTVNVKDLGSRQSFDGLDLEEAVTRAAEIVGRAEEAAAGGADTHGPQTTGGAGADAGEPQADGEAPGPDIHKGAPADG